jgi:peptidoglycan/LPS O-acetylase OafA/YrhL
LTRLYVVLIPALLLTKLLDTLGLRLAREGSVYFTTKEIGLVVTLGLTQRLGIPDMLGNLLFLQDIRVPEFGTDVALWSLANEFWYYIIFPLGLIAFLDRKSSKVKRICFVIMAVALLAFVGPRIQLLFPTWILGAFLVLLPYRLSPAAARWGTLLATMALVMTMVLVRALSFMPLVADYLLAIVSCVAVFCIVQHRSPAKNSLYRRVAAFFSNISYSLYLFHLPLSIFLCGFINDPWRRWRFTLASIGCYLAVDAVVMLAVYVLWRLFEANTDWFRRRVFGR